MPDRLFRSFSALTLFAWRCRHVLPARKETLPSPARLNLGSGTAIAAGWTNLDSDAAFLILRSRLLVRKLRWVNMISPESYERSRQGVFDRIRFWDLRRSLPFSGESVDFIYASHLLEHFALPDARRLLWESHRVLKPGGVLRVVVPDLLSWASQYVSAAEKGSGDSPVEFLGESAPAHELGRRFLRIVQDWGHRSAFDFASLSYELRSAGFRAVERSDFRKGRVPDLDVIESELYRRLSSLYVEATK